MTSQSSNSPSNPSPPLSNQPTQAENEALHEWRSHPITQAVMQKLRVEREELKEAWASGQFNEDIRVSAEAAGFCRAIDKIINIKAEDLKL